jgi:hypothetical protein
VAYFTAVLLRDGDKWSARDVDLDDLADLGELADRLRLIEAGDEPVLEAAAEGTCGGDFDVLADLGTSPDDLRGMCEDEMVPMDALAVVAEAAGFAELLDSLR